MSLEAYATLALEAEHAWERAETFAGRSLVEFDPETGLCQVDLATQAVSFPLERAPIRHRHSTPLDQLIYDARACEIEALSLRPVSEDGLYTGHDVLVPSCADLTAPFLPKLRSLFLCDVTCEEYSATWQQQPGAEGVLTQLPELEVLRLRGQGHKLATRFEHAHLRALQVQFHGSPQLLYALGTADLPRLEMLEVWIGQDDYNDALRPEHMIPLLSGKVFPSLRWLGLRNAEQGDAVAAAVAESPLLGRLDALDLSLSCLSDPGVEALLAAPGLRSLKRLHLDQHAAHPATIARLEQVGIPLLTAPGHPRGVLLPNSDQRRYTAVGE